MGTYNGNSACRVAWGSRGQISRRNPSNMGGEAVLSSVHVYRWYMMIFCFLTTQWSIPTTVPYKYDCFYFIKLNLENTILTIMTMGFIKTCCQKQAVAHLLMMTNVISYSHLACSFQYFSELVKIHPVRSL